MTYFSDSDFFSGRMSLQSVSISKLISAQETINSTSISANVLTANAGDGSVFFVSTAPAANFTVNITNLNSIDNKVSSFTFFITQGATGYIPNALQVAGVGQTIKWASSIAPTPTSGVGKIDVFNFVLIRLSGAWTCLGDISKNY
jgi:hypothetical protein